MSDQNPDNGTVRIFEADNTLKQKLGPNATFDQAVPPQTVVAAEQVIVRAADDVLANIKSELGRLQLATDQLREGVAGDAALKSLVAAAFAIKSSAGLCGYAFASALAKSLHVYCETDAVMRQPLTSKNIAIIRTEVDGLKAVFAGKVTGDGGETGKVILGELHRLSSSS